MNMDKNRELKEMSGELPTQQQRLMSQRDETVSMQTRIITLEEVIDKLNKSPTSTSTPSHEKVNEVPSSTTVKEKRIPLAWCFAIILSLMVSHTGLCEYGPLLKY